ncbi:unnamed protein product [Schistosoma mattheei]|uniref:Uncharacterized protein n=1 Tax=Schistosoma mattheei TaxID=31246 RepID=A0A183Q5B3_9TREM|nr:unnamed protein product [Schistosoma mattheei]
MGSIIDEQGGSDADVKARIGKARVAFLQSKNIWNSKQISINIKNVVNTIVQYPRIADQLSESLGNLMILWESLRKLIRERGDYMVQLHRGMLTLYLVALYIS